MGIYDEDQSTSSQNGRVKFTTKNIDQFIRSHGASVLWESAVLSPNRTEDGQPRQTEGSGNGLIYLKPKTTYALLQAMDRKAMNSLVGMTTVGTALLTTKRSDKMAVRDRITFDDQSIPEKILLKVNPKDVTSGINLRYNVKEVETALVPTINGFDYTDPNNLNIDYDKNIFYPTKDMIGKYISLNIIAELRFYVVNIIREGRFQYEGDVAQMKENRDMTELPRLLAIRREDMYIPDIIGEDNDKVSVTGEELDPRPTVDYEMQGFFDN